MAQWKNPELVVAGLSAGVAGLNSLGRIKTSNISKVNANVVSSNVERVSELAKIHLGDGAKSITNRSGDLVFLSKDGTRKIRFDINNPSPHVNIHSHVEYLRNGKWIKSDHYILKILINFNMNCYDNF